MLNKKTVAMVGSEKYQILGSIKKLINIWKWTWMVLVVIYKWAQGFMKNMRKHTQIYTSGLVMYNWAVKRS